MEIKYTKLENEVKIETGDLSKDFDIYQLPLKLQIVKSVNKKIVTWSCNLNSNCWASCKLNLEDIIIRDSQDNIVWTLEYNPDGEIKFQHLIRMWCLGCSKKPNGLIIGANDGLDGEWVYSIISNSSNAVLIEASENTYNRLKENYLEHNNVVTINGLVSVDGEDINFYEAENDHRGTLSSVIPNHHDKFDLGGWKMGDIKSTLRKSSCLYDMLELYKPDWIHMDTEGLDVDLLFSIIESPLLPRLISFEYAHADVNKLDEIVVILKELNYSLEKDLENILAVKKYES
jgi:FkbM family methyltransferase